MSLFRKDKYKCVFSINGNEYTTYAGSMTKLINGFWVDKNNQFTEVERLFVFFVMPHFIQSITIKA